MLSSHMQEKHSVHHLTSLQFHRDVNILMLSSMGCLFIINYFKYICTFKNKNSVIKILVYGSFIDFTHVAGTPDITQINVIVLAIITRF